MSYSASCDLITSSPILARARVSSRSSGSLRLFSPGFPARGRPAASSRARAPGPGSHERPRRAAPRAGTAGPVRPSAGCSTARELRLTRRARRFGR